MAEKEGIIITNSNKIETKSSEGNLMKDEFDEFVKTANMIAIAKLLLREGVIDNGSYNSIVYRIKTPS